MSSSVDCNSLVFDALKSTNIIEQLDIIIEEYGALEVMNKLISIQVKCGLQAISKDIINLLHEKGIDFNNNNIINISRLDDETFIYLLNNFQYSPNLLCHELRNLSISRIRLIIEFCLQKGNIHKNIVFELCTPYDKVMSDDFTERVYELMSDNGLVNKDILETIIATTMVYWCSDLTVYTRSVDEMIIEAYEYYSYRKSKLVNLLISSGINLEISCILDRFIKIYDRHSMQEEICKAIIYLRILFNLNNEEMYDLCNHFISTNLKKMKMIVCESVIVMYESGISIDALLDYLAEDNKRSDRFSDSNVITILNIYMRYLGFSIDSIINNIISTR